MRGIWKILLSMAGSFLVTGLVCSFFCAVHDNTTFWPSFKNGFTGAFLGVDLLFAFMVSLCVLYDDLTKNDQHNWDTLIKTRNLVLHPEIDYFESRHLTIAEHIIFAPAGGPKSRILALDSTSPAEWWANNMLGYLALQARWAMAEKGRSVSRLFVWSNSNFQSTAGMKIIQLHRLFGFETYIISSQCWDWLAKRHHAKALDRECFVWDDGTATACRVDQMAAETMGYKSFWKLSDGETERDRLIEQMEASGKKVFFAPMDATCAAQYRAFLDLLCKDSDVTKLNTLNVDGIHNEIMQHVDKHKA